MSDATEVDRDLPDWVIRLAERGPGLAVLSALESTVLPIPLEAVLVPLMISRPGHAIRMGLWALLGCVIGSLALYGAGYLAQPLVDMAVDRLGLMQDFKDMQDQLEGGNLFATVALVSLSPAPVQLASLGSGAVAANLAVFSAAILVSRGVRYVGLGLLAKLLGPRLQRMKIPLWVLMLIPFVLIVAFMLL